MRLISEPLRWRLSQTGGNKESGVWMIEASYEEVEAGHHNTGCDLQTDISGFEGELGYAINALHVLCISLLPHRGDLEMYIIAAVSR